MTGKRLEEFKQKAQKIKDLLPQESIADAFLETLAFVDELLPVVRRYINYHDGVARCDSAEEVQTCECSVCSVARLIIAELESK